MKIPDAYFSGGLGQRVAQVVPGARPDPSGALEIGRAGERLGATLLQGATDAIEFQGRRELQAAMERKSAMERMQAEQAAELKQLAKERENATAKREYLNFTPGLSALQQQIIDDPDTPPEEYPVVFRAKARQLAMDQLYPTLNEHQRNLIEPQVLEHINTAAEQIYKTGQQEINDQAWAEGIATLTALKNDPTRDVRTKLAIIKDENFFSETGRPAHEIETVRQKAVQEIISEDAAHRFNSTKQDLKNLRTFKQSLQSQDKNGNYTYMPEWDPKEREQYISMVMAKEETLINQEQQRIREANAAARAARSQEATNLMMEYKDKVATGWIPTTAADFRFQAAVRSYAATSPSLARQYQETTSFTTDFSKRLELKKKDPLGVAAAEAGYQLPPLNVLDVAGLPQQLAQRMAVAKKLNVKAIFKGDEIKALSELMQTLPPPQQTKLMASISKPLGPAISAATWRTASEQVQQDRPDQAVMFRLFAQGKPAEAQLYAEGRGYLTGEKKDFLKDKFAVVQQDIGDRLKKKLGTALAALPQTRNTISDAVATVYLGEAYRRNIPLDSINKDLLDDVTRRVVGETVRTGSYYGSNKTTLVPDGLKPDQFLNSIKAITPADIAARGGIDGMTDPEAASYLKKVAWHEGNGGYTFVREGKPLYGKNGRPFTFRLDDGVGAK